MPYKPGLMGPAGSIDLRLNRRCQRLAWHVPAVDTLTASCVRPHKRQDSTIKRTSSSPTMSIRADDNCVAAVEEPDLPRHTRGPWKPVSCWPEYALHHSHAEVIGFHRLELAREFRGGAVPHHHRRITKVAPVPEPYPASA
jgi:hypothetical protein